MKWITVLALLVVCCMCLSVVQASFDDCCLTYVKEESRAMLIIQRHAVVYTRQMADGSCNIPAVIFTTRKNRVYCTNPAKQWVRKVIDRIDKRGKSKNGRRPIKG